MRAVAEHKQQHGTIWCIDQQSQLFKCESESVVNNFRNGTINCNRDVDEPEKESFFFSSVFFCRHVNRPLIKYGTDMNKQYVEYVRASERSKKPKLSELILRFCVESDCRRNFAAIKPVQICHFTYMRFPTLAAIHSNSAKDIYTAI